MAYGKGTTKDKEKRMIDLGRSPVDAALSLLRERYVEAANHISESARQDDILTDLPHGKGLDAVMLKAQADMKGRLNSVWAEKARIAAKAALTERHKRARKTLFGRLKNIDTLGDKPMPDGVHRLVNLPEEFSRRLSPKDIADLKALAEILDFKGVLDLFRKVREGRCNLPAPQSEALSAMLDAVQAKFRHPTWTLDDNTVAQLHLDFRCVPDKALVPTLQRLTQGLAADVPTAVHLLVAAPVARQKPLAVKATLRPSIVKRLLGDENPGLFAVTSLCLEISRDHVTVKGVLSREPKVMPLSEVRHLVGRDYGYRNTVALGVVPLDGAIAEELLSPDVKWTKGKAKAYLESHVHDAEPVETVVLDGKDFQAAVNRHAERIDRLRGEIDLTYNRIHRLKYEVNRALGLPPDRNVDLDLETEDRKVADWIGRLRRLLDRVGHLKVLRRNEYRAIDGVKRSWFGHVSGVEMRLAKKYDAAVVREDLTVVAAEKGGPEYKGRTFNKMLNNGSKGQYIRRASGKLKWNGVPELVVPSYYTSCTDVRHGVIDAKQRKGPVFRAAQDGATWDADKHAAKVLALWPILRPKTAELGAGFRAMMGFVTKTEAGVRGVRPPAEAPTKALA